MSMSKVKDALKKNTMLIALVVITIFFAWKTNGTLLAPQNITNLISQNGYVVILAVGMLLCILTGGNIDLSVGSIVALVGALAGKLIVTYKMNIYVAILICLLAGIALGIWQGYWIAYVRIPAFIVTLSGMLFFRGIALIILDGLTISPFPDKFLNLFNSFIPDYLGGEVLNIFAILVGVAVCAIYIGLTMRTRIKRAQSGYAMESMSRMIGRVVIVSILVLMASYSLAQYKGVPSILILLTVVVLGYTYFTSKTVPGRHFYAVGGNEKAAKLSGINTDKILMIAYVNMAFLSAIVALICVARFNSAAPTAGQNYELDAIGACYVGGASAYGGTGTIAGVVVGAIFMGVLNNGMSIMGIDSNVQKAVKGLVLLAAVAFDVLSKKRGQTA